MSTNLKYKNVLYGEVPFGCYAKNGKGCLEIISMVTPMVLKAADNIEFEKTDKPFVICEYGAADGENSMSLIREVIECVKLNYGEAQPVHIVYEDQPVNDFRALFRTVQGNESYLNDFKEVYVTASGTNFYEQCLPTGSVHLGLSFTAMQWLSKRPCNLSDSIHHLESKIEAEKEMFRQQAATDWENLLLNRAKELAHGGEMVLLLCCIDEKGQRTGKTGDKKNSDNEIMARLWKSMVSKEEFINTNINSYDRTEAEIRAPFQDKESTVSTAGLRLIEAKILVANCPFFSEWTNSEKTKADAVAYAKNLVTRQRLWVTSTLVSGLSDKRSSDKKAEIVDAFFQKYEDLVAEKPEDYFKDFVEMSLHIKKL